MGGTTKEGIPDQSRISPGAPPSSPPWPGPSHGLSHGFSHGCHHHPQRRWHGPQGHPDHRGDTPRLRS